jgi:hypothetical protein
MSLFVYPPIAVNTTGLATEAKQDVTNTKLDTLHTDIGSTNTKLDTLHTDIGSTNTKLDTLSAKTAKTGFFTKSYDQIVPTTDATHDYYTSKLATVSQQVLTITYADATKAVATDYKVV